MPNNFPAHLMALWPTFNLAATLKDGFQKTGIFPFSPELIRSTVKPVAKPVQVAVSAMPSPKKRKLREALAEMNLSEFDIKALMDEADRRVRGVTVGYDNAKKYLR